MNTSSIGVNLLGSMTNRRKSMFRYDSVRRSFALTLILIGCLAAVPAAWSQTATGRIVGTITDPTSAVIPGVSITVTNVDTNVTYQGITNEQGAYQIPLLPIGNYTVTAELAGFQKAAT